MNTMWVTLALAVVLPTGLGALISICYRRGSKSPIILLGISTCVSYVAIFGVSLVLIFGIPSMDPLSDRGASMLVYLMLVPLIIFLCALHSIVGWAVVAWYRERTRRGNGG